MEREKSQIRDILDQMQDGIYITDADTGALLFMNRKMTETYGIRNALELKSWEEQNGKSEKGFPGYDSLILWEGKRARMRQVSGKAWGRQEREGAGRDSLCNVWNRTAGKEMLERKLAKLDEDSSCVLVFLDMDHIRQINDYYGFSEGDLVLKTVCEVLSSRMEEPDFMFRLTGDKFIMIFFDKNPEAVSRTILEWRTETEQLSAFCEKPYAVSFSYGLSCTNGRKKCTMEELLEQADARMYEEKLRNLRNEALVRSEEITLKDSHEKMKMDYPAEYLYDAIIRSTDDYVYVCNMKTGFFQYTPAQVEAFALPGEVIQDPLEYWREIVHPDDWDRFYRSNMEIGENKMDAHYVEFRARVRSGEYQWLRCRGHMIRDEYGEPALFAGIMHRMGGQNEVDPLTQLLNYQMFDKRLRQLVKGIEIESLAVVILDMDNFRQINEMYSRKVGDDIFATIAHNIQSVLPDNAGLYRLDNDRMGLLVGNGSDEEVLELYERLKKRLRIMKEWKTYKIEVRLSAGSAFFPRDGKTAEELCQYADYALQYAKSQGKDRMVIFTEEILNKKNHRLELIKKLRDAISHNFRGFFVNYQPQVDGADGRIIGAEALARFRDEEGQFISPAEFIPIMEAEGMIQALGLWMVRKSVQAAGKWLEINPDFSISVNASALQLMDDTYIEDVKRILAEESFPAGNLVIELTESSAVQNLDMFRDKYKLLQEMGIRVAMDDFGTGYSSLEFLKNAPIDLVKIDRGFVRDILNSRFDSAFITFIVAICHDAGMKVCQEGVETKEEYELLKKMEVDCIQGYYFGKPMEQEAFTGQLAAGI